MIELIREKSRGWDPSNKFNSGRLKYGLLDWIFINSVAIKLKFVLAPCYFQLSELDKRKDPPLRRR